MIFQALHSNPLESYIKKRVGWTDRVFHWIGREAHKLAISSHKWVQQLRIVKLSHGLYQTNYMAYQMYGTSDKCPCCTSSIETLAHVFRCPDLAASTHRNSAKQKLEAALLINTPTKLVQMLLHGLEQWELQESCTNVPMVPLYRGSIYPDEILLIQANSRSKIASVGNISYEEG
jgi:hypothetical protein